MKPIFIAHRINTRAMLAQVPVEYGVEIDIRDSGSRLILQHDPFGDGEDLEDYLKEYHHRFIIFNVKSERIELRIRELIEKYKIQEYFFLDSSFPMIYLLSSHGERNVAVRFSEYEGLDTVLAMQGRINWVWVDCFTRLPIDQQKYELLKRAGFKLCLVSPELQGRGSEIPAYRDFLDSSGIHFDAICSKLPNLATWL